MSGNLAERQLTEAVEAGDDRTARRVLGRLQADEASRGPLLGLLADQAAAGSELAVELLAETVDDLGLARTAVKRFLVDEAAVDDVTQDTLVSMAGSIATFRGDAQFTTWLYRIARNRAVDHLRRQRATEPLGPEDLGPAEGVPSDRLSAQGFGETRPVAPDTNEDGSDNPDGRAQNRRVEIIIEGVDLSELPVPPS